MKLAIIATLAVLFVLNIKAYPLDDAAGDESHLEHARFKRFTCDVLSAEARGVKVNHSACAAHCLFRGRSGGYCNGRGVCICR